METLAIVNPVILYFPEEKVKEVLFWTDKLVVMALLELRLLLPVHVHVHHSVHNRPKW